MSASAPLLYLASEDVDACLPTLDRQLELAGEALLALAAGDAEMPPKVGVHPRDGALLHAMPAWVRPRDLVGMKWVSAYRGNLERGAPAINGLIVLNDAHTGLATCVMDAGRITAVRTAAVTGVALRLMAGQIRATPARVAIIGAGVQAHSHVAVIGHVLAGAELQIHDRHPDRASELADWAAWQPGIGAATTADTPADAFDGAHVVVTVAALGSMSQVLTVADLEPGTIVVAVDFATYASGALADAAAGTDRFIVDDRAQFLAYRASGSFDGYPEPSATLGELLMNGGFIGERRPDAPTLITHLGVGIADVLFAEEVRTAAEGERRGTRLAR